MKKLIALVGFIWVCSMFSCTMKDREAKQAEVEVTVETDSLRLIFAGDVMVHDAQLGGALLDGGDTTYNFRPPFQYIKKYISSADLALANLELTLGGKPYRGYPTFSSPPELLDALKECGFDVFFLANNHILDRGRNGLEETITRLSEAGVYQTGAFVDSQTRRATYPLIIEKGNFKLAFLNYTYDTNGLVISKPNIVNYIDTLLVRRDLAKAKEANPDFIITYMHWGEEYMRQENSQQRFLARFLAEHGTDLIIGSHPHVVQPFDRIITQRGDTVPVIYSLGNFISNQRDRYCDGGITFDVLLTKSEGKTALASMKYKPMWVNRIARGNRFIYRIIPANDYPRNKSVYKLDKQEQAQIKQFHTDTRKHLSVLK